MRNELIKTPERAMGYLDEYFKSLFKRVENSVAERFKTASRQILMEDIDEGELQEWIIEAIKKEIE